MPAPLTPFDKDLFVGVRLAAKDTQDAQLLGGAVIDMSDGSMLLFVEAERRIGQDWMAELEGRFFTNVSNQNSLAAFKADGSAILRLTRHF
jgi:hypothetical protein